MAEAQTTVETRRKVATMPREAKDKGALAVVTPPTMTPMAMLQHAVEHGTNIEMLGKLMDLQERWEATEAKKAFTHALAAFKANAPEIMKNKTAGFESKRTGDSVAYQYATLDQVCAVIAPALSQHGLSHTWEVEQSSGGVIKVTCVLTHEAGHSEKVSLVAGADASGAKNSIQAIGSTVSYLERYTLLAATGLAARDMDDDAGADRARRPQREQYGIMPARHVPVPKNKGGGDDWGAWCKSIDAAIKAAKTLTDLDEICLANDALLADCRDGGPKAATKVETAIKLRRAELAPKPFTYVDFNHHTVSQADADNAADQFLSLLTDAERRGADQLDALWEANTLSGQLRDAGRADLADQVKDAYALARSRLKAAAAPPQKPAGEAPTTQAPPPTTEAPKAPAAAPAAPQRPSLASLSPFRPGVKGTNEAWAQWVDGFLVELAANGHGDVKAFLDANKRELNYVKAYSADLGNLWDKIAVAIDQKRA